MSIEVHLNRSVTVSLSPVVDAEVRTGAEGASTYQSFGRVRSNIAALEPSQRLVAK
jgi:hypothetical protein